MTKNKLWTKNFLLISLTNFFTHIVFYALMTTVAMHVINEYGASKSVAGLTTGIFIVAALVARIFTGMYMDRIGRKRMFIIGLLIFVLSMISYFFASSITMIIILRIIQGLSHGIITNTAGTVVVSFIPSNRRGEGIGYYSTFMNIAMAVGPFLGMFISQNSSFDTIIVVCSIIAFIDLLTVLWLSVPELDVSAKPLKFNFDHLFELKSIPISFIMFLVALGYSSLLSFLSLYGKELNLETAASYFFLVYAIALILSRPFTGKFFDKYGENAISYPLLIVLGIGFILLSQTQNAFMLFLSAALIGISFGTIQSNFQAIAVRLAGPYRTAQATTTYWILFDTGTGFGPYLIGILVGYISYQTMYFVVGIWAFICIVLYFIAHGRKVTTRKVQVRSKNLDL